MKTTAIVITVVLGFQVSLLANNFSSKVTRDLNSLLTPATPVEATFEDIIPAAVFDFTSLAPVLPAEAGFEDLVPENSVNLFELAPVTPAEADFEEISVSVLPAIKGLAPNTPAVASFTDEGSL